MVHFSPQISYCNHHALTQTIALHSLISREYYIESHSD
nr:MAG TPA: hypothetical protein [Bacteriophage sp.]